MTERKPTPEALEAALKFGSRYVATSLNTGAREALDELALALDAFAARAVAAERERCLKEFKLLDDLIKRIRSGEAP